MIKKTAVTIVTGAFLLIPPAAMSELRDPTMPNGYFQQLYHTEVDLKSSDALRLQAIIYSPLNKGAIINGRRFEVGDQVADATIKAIHADYIVLVDAEGESQLKLVSPSVKSRAVESQVKPVRGMK